MCTRTSHNDHPTRDTSRQMPAVRKRRSDREVWLIAEPKFWPPTILFSSAMSGGGSYKSRLFNEFKITCERRIAVRTMTSR
jgi:hypothetical protein